MLETKKITLSDNGVVKTFTISPLPALQALKLAREVMSLLSDTQLIKSVILKQMIHDVLDTGVKIEGFDQEAFNAMVQIDNTEMIANLITSIINGLNDENLETLIRKSLANVIYHNGVAQSYATEAMDMEMIKDFTVIIALIKEVFVVNFAGAIDRIKKLLGLSATADEEPKN